MKTNRRSQLVFGAILAFVVSLSGVRGVAAEAEVPATDLVLEPLAAPQGFQWPGFGGGFGGFGGGSGGGSTGGGGGGAPGPGSFFGGLRFGGSSGGSGGSGGGSGGGGGSFTPRPGNASGFFPGRYR